MNPLTIWIVAVEVVIYIILASLGLGTAAVIIFAAVLLVAILRRLVIKAIKGE